MNSLHHSANPLHHNTGSQNNCFQRETEWASWTNAWMENGVWVNILSSAAWCFGASSSSLLPPALVQYWALSLRDKKRKSVDFRVSRDFEILWEQELWLEESCKEDKSCLSNLFLKRSQTHKKIQILHGTSHFKFPTANWDFSVVRYSFYFILG